MKLKITIHIVIATASTILEPLSPLRTTNSITKNIKDNNKITEPVITNETKTLKGVGKTKIRIKKPIKIANKAATPSSPKHKPPKQTNTNNKHIIKQIKNHIQNKPFSP